MYTGLIEVLKKLTLKIISPNRLLFYVMLKGL